MTRCLNLFAFIGCLLCLFAIDHVSPVAHAATNEITWSLKYDPKTLDPAKVDDQASETIRFLTGGVLLRFNRKTQQIEPALASSWSVSADGRTVNFQLRPGLRFSDGSPLTSADVVASLKRVLTPATAAPVAEEFIEPSAVAVEAIDPLHVRVRLAKRVVAIGKIFDEIAIEPGGRSTDAHVTAGSVTVADYKRGEYFLLKRNPNYWKKGVNGAALPILASMKLDILENREQDELRFIRGQYQLIESVPADNFSLLAKRSPQGVHDLGPSLNTEQLWFNQSQAAPLPDWERKWFRTREFRVAVSEAIHRADLARVAYEGHATPAGAFISPANSIWGNTKLQPVHESSAAALQELGKAGFRLTGKKLVDAEGHEVKFSILTNAGNRPRERMAALIQQDLAAIGMQVNVVTLDFPALIDRLMHTQNYEAAMLGLSNVEPDPSSMMNVWLSSSPNHQWNPSQKTPSTTWEAEIDKQMTLQAATSDQNLRKLAVDRVQEIVVEQQPFIYLVHPNALCAVSPNLSGVEFSILQPAVLSSVDTMQWKGN